MKTDNLRKSLISRIHIAKNQLTMDDATYRAMLISATEVDSCAKMSIQQLEATYKVMQKLGFKPKFSKTKGKPKNFNSSSMPLMITKIEALLSSMQLPWAYADGIVKRMYGIERCAWVREPAQLKAVIAALHNLQKKTANERPL